MAANPNPHEIWHASPSKAEQLSVLLADPVFIEALAVMRFISPAVQSASTPAHIISNNGDAFAGQISGYEKALRNLKQLSEQPPETPKQAQETYGVDPNKPTE